jgi:riboflavin kinase
LKPYHIATLKHIALLGGVKGPVSFSSASLGCVLGVSQQTASKRLLDLARDGLITRNIVARREQVKLTSKGVEALRREHADYKRIFEISKELILRGVVESGLGEGAFYMRQKGYKEQFARKLGYEPYEGTLNLRCSGKDMANLDVLRQADGIQIEEFHSGGRMFGGAKCFRATMSGVECAVIMPLRSHHSDTVELISRVNLRTRLGLKDGDTAELSVLL